MFEDYIVMEMEDGSELYIQKAPIYIGGEIPASGGDHNTVKAMECLNNAMPAVKEFCAEIRDSLKEKLEPDEIKLEFSVSFSGDLKAFIASAGAEAGVSVQLVWKKEDK